MPDRLSLVLQSQGTVQHLEEVVQKLKAELKSSDQVGGWQLLSGEQSPGPQDRPFSPAPRSLPGCLQWKPPCVLSTLRTCLMCGHANRSREENGGTFLQCGSARAGAIFRKWSQHPQWSWAMEGHSSPWAAFSWDVTCGVSNDGHLCPGRCRNTPRS